ncbi:hypothetical protein [Sphingobium sp. CFD-2]|uniref:hypothetical protein n=1 Tax=Sphingobium sp. CFD-2 TaxID=2878542 RepID=UPI00214C9267|nr:hypothetical protein [Sphingobium sp. CFD-2]
MIHTHCKGCGKEFKRKSGRKTGYCQPCYMRDVHHDRAEVREGLSRAMKAKLADPHERAAHIARTRRGRIERLARDPEFREMVRQQGKAVGALGLGGHQPKGSPSRIAAGKAVTATKLADIPLEYRELHKKLRKEFGATESRRMIRQQMAADEARMSAHERQLRAISRGAKIVKKFKPSADTGPFTLGGIATGMI